MTNGPCLAMEIRQENVVDEFKKLAGSFDPEIARSKGQTDTFRAKYGVDKYLNAVHCTDLVDEGILESEFFFVLLQEKKFKQDQYHMSFNH